MATAKELSNTRKAEIGAGIAAGVAAAALGAYFLYGSKDAKKNRAKVKGWALKAKGEVLQELENMERVTEDSYERVVNNVIANYKGARNVSASELMALASDLRRHWKALKPMFQDGRRGAVHGGRGRNKSSGKRRAPSRRKNTRKQ